jgi:hypothetical protein
MDNDKSIQSPYLTGPTGRLVMVAVDFKEHLFACKIPTFLA